MIVAAMHTKHCGDPGAGMTCSSGSNLELTFLCRCSAANKHPVRPQTVEILDTLNKRTPILMVITFVQIYTVIRKFDMIEYVGVALPIDGNWIYDIYINPSHVCCKPDKMYHLTLHSSNLFD